MQLLHNLFVAALRPGLHSVARNIRRRPKCGKNRRCIGGAQRQNVAGRKLANTMVNGVRRRNVSATHVGSQSVAVDLGLKSRKNLKSLQFGRKHETSVNVTIVKRLDSDAVPHQMKPLFETVPQGEGEHAYKTQDRGMQPPAFYGRQHDLGIGVAAPCVRAEFRPYLFVVIDLAIEDDVVAARSRCHRLMPFSRKIDDGKSSEGKAQTCAAIVESAGVVRSPMGQRVSHPVEEFNRVFSKRFFKPESGYSTHACCPRLFPVRTELIPKHWPAMPTHKFLQALQRLYYALHGLKRAGYIALPLATGQIVRFAARPSYGEHQSLWAYGELTQWHRPLRPDSPLGTERCADHGTEVHGLRPRNR